MGFWDDLTGAISGGYQQFKDQAFGAVPNYQNYAQQQATAQNQQVADQTLANRPTQINPFGMSGWSKDSNGNWIQNVSMNPADQANLDASRGLAGGLFGTAQGLMGRQLNFGAIPGLSTADQARQRAEDAIYGRLTSRLNPQWDQRENQLKTQLANQGIDPQDTSYGTELQNFNNARTDAYQQAQDAAIQGGGQEASRLFGMDLQAHNSALNDQMQGQQFGLNGLNAGLATLHGATPGMPNFSPFSTAGSGIAPNYLSAAQLGYAGQTAQNQGITDYMGSLFGALGQGAKIGGSMAAGGQSPYGNPYGYYAPNVGTTYPG